MPRKVTKNSKVDQESSSAPSITESISTVSPTDMNATVDMAGKEIAKLNENDSFQLACAILSLDGFPDKMKINMAKFAQLGSYKGPSVSSTIITRLKKTLYKFQDDLVSGATVPPHRAGNLKRSKTGGSSRPVKKAKMESNKSGDSSDEASIVNPSPITKGRKSRAKSGPTKKRAPQKMKKEDTHSMSESEEPKAGGKKKNSAKEDQAPKAKPEDDDGSTGADEDFIIATENSSNEAGDSKQQKSTASVKEEDSD